MSNLFSLHDSTYIDYGKRSSHCQYMHNRTAFYIIVHIQTIVDHCTYGNNAGTGLVLRLLGLGMAMGPWLEAGVGTWSDAFAGGGVVSGWSWTLCFG
jgi:hypothetical protein